MTYISNQIDHWILDTEYTNPNDESKGSRNVHVRIKQNQSSLFISEKELEDEYNYKGKLTRPKIKNGEIIRFKDIFDVEISSLGDPVMAEFKSFEKGQSGKIIQAVPENDYVNVKILQPDGTITKGYGEANLREVPRDEIVQFVRYGFVCPKEISDDEIFCYFTH